MGLGKCGTRRSTHREDAQTETNPGREKRMRWGREPECAAVGKCPCGRLTWIGRVKWETGLLRSRGTAPRNSTPPEIQTQLFVFLFAWALLPFFFPLKISSKISARNGLVLSLK